MGVVVWYSPSLSTSYQVLIINSKYKQSFKIKDPATLQIFEFGDFHLPTRIFSGESSEYLDLEILSDMRDYGDLSLRLKTDINNGDSIYTDLNGHTVQQHRYKAKLTTQGNFFPVPTTVFIQDSSRRLTVAGSEPHGGASLENGKNIMNLLKWNCVL